jgi:hypothetical protein
VEFLWQFSSGIDSLYFSTPQTNLKLETRLGFSLILISN